jgi:hypothetical protein
MSIFAPLNASATPFQLRTEFERITITAYDQYAATSQHENTPVKRAMALNLKRTLDDWVGKKPAGVPDQQKMVMAVGKIAEDILKNLTKADIDNCKTAIDRISMCIFVD